MDIILPFLLAISIVSVSSLPLENTGVDCGQCAKDFVELGGCDCLKQGDSCDVYSFVAEECLVCEDDSENPCPSENDVLVCETNGGDDASKQCVFPFSYEGETYEQCTSVGNNGTEWCSTEVDENGEYVSGKWGNCGSGCFKDNDALLLVPTCPRGESAECCDGDESCSDGDDDWCCDAVFYCSNDGVDYAKEKGGILCPGNDNNNEDAVDDNNGAPICPEGGAAECCDEDESCYDGDDDWCCNDSFYCSNDGAEYAEENGGIICPGNDATAGDYTDGGITLQ